MGFTGWSKLKERVLQYDFMIIDRKFYFYPLFNWLRNIKNFIYSVSSRSNNEFYIRGNIPTHSWVKIGWKSVIGWSERMTGLKLSGLTEILPLWLFWISLYEVRGSSGSFLSYRYFEHFESNRGSWKLRWWAHELLISLDYGKRIERKELWDDENRLLDAIYLWFLDCH